jgi:hypothetical protein
MPYTVRFPRVPPSRRDYMFRWCAARRTTGICTRVGRGHEAPTTLPTLGHLARVVGAFTLIVVSTPPRPRAEGVGTLAYGMYAECSSDGIAISGYAPRCPLGLAVIHPDGSSQRQLTGDSADAEPAWSPGGLRTMEALGSQLFVINGDDTGFTQLTFPPGHHAFPLRFLSSRAKRSAK